MSINISRNEGISVSLYQSDIGYRLYGIALEGARHSSEASGVGQTAELAIASGKQRQASKHLVRCEGRAALRTPYSFLYQAKSLQRTLMDILGHSQISLPMNPYSHVLPEMTRAAVGFMDAVLGGEK